MNPIFFVSHDFMQINFSSIWPRKGQIIIEREIGRGWRTFNAGREYKYRVKVYTGAAEEADSRY